MVNKTAGYQELGGNLPVDTCETIVVLNFHQLTKCGNFPYFPQEDPLKSQPPSVHFDLDLTLTSKKKRNKKIRYESRGMGARCTAVLDVS